MPTTLADAPIGVALPPISVPSARVHARTDKSAPDVAARLLMIGIIVAENGILSMMALATADTHIIMITIKVTFPPLIIWIKLAISSRMPVSSRPPTTTNSPMKKIRVG